MPSAPHAPHPFQAEQRTIVRPPENEVPTGAVPEARQHHRDHQVAIDGRVPTAPRRQRQVDVIADPGGEGNVPPAPELRDARRQERAVEIDREMEAHELC